ncbi:hypothetical protein OH77DRAFT_1525612 [Trametes cingulata]|nr:hypothetical protein OH77DRAFT_1525612 [Trametes cingulata]
MSTAIYVRLPAIAEEEEEDIWARLGLDDDVRDIDVVAEEQACRREDEDCGLVDGDVLAEVTSAKRKVPGYPRTPEGVAAFIGYPHLPDLIRRFLYVQENPDHEVAGDLDLRICPPVPPRISVYPSAVAVFYAPSDLSGV